MAVKLGRGGGATSPATRQPPTPAPDDTQFVGPCTKERDHLCPQHLGLTGHALDDCAVDLNSLASSHALTITPSPRSTSMLAAGTSTVHRCERMVRHAQCNGEHGAQADWGVHVRRKQAGACM